MRISRNFDPPSAEIKNEIFNVEKDDSGYPKKISIDEILAEHFNSWNIIKLQFKKDFSVFDSLLLKLHFKRKKSFSPVSRFHILKFLSIGYYFSKDVRYFNEFLFFFTEEDKNNQIKNLVIEIFFQNLDSKNRHLFPVASIEDAKKWIESNRAKNEEFLIHGKQGSNVGLIGIPTFFKNSYNALLEKGYNVFVYSVPHHSDKKISFLLKNKIVWFLYSFLKGIPPYKNLDFKYDSKEIYSAIVKDMPEVGFHKLGFIIRENIFGAFSKGLLNDHWAILPFIRGRSSIEYSLLYGFPIAVTTHFIDKKIDEGKIARIFEYDIDGLKSISAIRKKIKSDLDNRIVQSIQAVTSPEFFVIENKPLQGLMHFEMHHTLCRWVEDEIIG